MSHKRFLRDHTLDSMLDEIRAISGKLSQRVFPGLIFSQSLESLTEMYETNRIVLQKLELAIESLRKSNENEEALNSIVEAAAHVQIGLVTIHNALKEDVGLLLQQISDLKDVLGIPQEDAVQK